MMNLTLLQKSFSKLASHKSIFFSADMPSDDVSKKVHFDYYYYQIPKRAADTQCP